MIPTALILAAHGDGDDSESNERVRLLAREIESGDGFAQVIPAFNKGMPGFDEVLDQVNANRVVVVPLMTSDGYFVKEVLPRRLSSESKDTREKKVTVTPPLGAAIEIEPMLLRAVNEVICLEAMDIGSTDVLVVGHGTMRNTQSSRRTNEIAKALVAASPIRSVSTAFLDEPPSIKEVLSRRADGDLVVIPFLFGGGGHVLEDIPLALGMAPLKAGYSDAIVFRRGEYKTVLLPPLGWMPGIKDVVHSVADQALDHREAART